MQRRVETYKMQVLLGLVISLVLAAFLAWGEAWPGVTGTNVILCRDQASYDQAVKMILANDWEAIARLVLMGRCTGWDAGTPVEVEDSSWGRLQVRRRGQVQTWWTAMEMIQRQETAPVPPTSGPPATVAKKPAKRAK